MKFGWTEEKSEIEWNKALVMSAMLNWDTYDADREIAQLKLDMVSREQGWSGVTTRVMADIYFELGY